MPNLPAVMDDLQTALQTVKMIGIFQENTKTRSDATHEEMIELYTDLTNRILADTKELKNRTGILGEKFLSKGLPWDRLKINAMKKGAPTDSVEVSFYFVH